MLTTRAVIAAAQTLLQTLTAAPWLAPHGAQRAVNRAGIHRMPSRYPAVVASVASQGRRPK